MSLFLIILIIVLLFISIQYMTNNKEGMDPGLIVQTYNSDKPGTASNAWKYISPWFSPTYNSPTYFDYNYRRGALFDPTRQGMMNYYYYRPYGLRKANSI